MGAVRSRLRRWHVWLGWLVGLPILFWTLSGVVMVIRPIEEVRGSALLADPAPLRLATRPVPPAIDGIALDSLSLEARVAGPRWVIRAGDTVRIADPATGRLLPPPGAADAAAEIRARYRGDAAIVAVHRTSRDAPPIDLRRPIDAWQVVMSDGTHFYVDAGSGEIVARRTRFWRFYDWMWGLHIMDLDQREDSHNPWVVTFGAAALLMSLLALALLLLTVRRPRRG